MADLFPETIETDRLRLEAAGSDAVDPFELYEAYSGEGLEEVMSFVPLSPYETPRESFEFIEHVASNREDRESVTYAIRPRDGEPGAGDLAGTTTLFCEWERRAAEFAIVLRRRFWGRGYSGERAAALLEVAFERLDLEVVTVSCMRENERSRRAIEKYVDRYGGAYDGLFPNAREVDGEPADLHRFSVTADQYAGVVA